MKRTLSDNSYGIDEEDKVIRMLPSPNGNWFFKGTMKHYIKCLKLELKNNLYLNFDLELIDPIFDKNLGKELTQ